LREAILKAVNLGDDADTTAAICGQISGAYYGESGIPPDRLERLAMREKIRQLAEQIRLSSPTVG
jgi:ADP-ribosyl-[dinitrogen reductase] hydrolase